MTDNLRTRPEGAPNEVAVVRGYIENGGYDHEALAALSSLEGRLADAQDESEHFKELFELETAVSKGYLERAVVAEGLLADAQEALRRLREHLDAVVEIAERVSWHWTDKPTLLAHLHVMQKDWPALSGWSSDGTGNDQDLGDAQSASCAGETP